MPNNTVKVIVKHHGQTGQVKVPNSAVKKGWFTVEFTPRTGPQQRVHVYDTGREENGMRIYEPL